MWAKVFAGEINFELQKQNFLLSDVTFLVEFVESLSKEII